MTDPRQWRMHAGRDTRNGGFRDFGHPKYVEMYGHDEIVPIEVTEVLGKSLDDPLDAGEYLGYMHFERTLSSGNVWGRADTEPVMVQGHEGIFSMQFPYGYRSEVERGDGEVVRLTAVELAAPPVEETLTAPDS